MLSLKNLVTAFLFVLFATTNSSAETTLMAKVFTSPQNKADIQMARRDFSAGNAPCHWVYWLQAPNLQKIAQAQCDVVVIDYSKDGSDEKRFTPEEIRTLQAAGKIVLAYFSIGEAEEYRFYWKNEWNENPPAFLGEENEDWEGNYKVRYWQSAWWQQALSPYLERILAQGFDGVYLDIVDAYWYWYEKGTKQYTAEDPTGTALMAEDVQIPANNMIDLVTRIADFSRKRVGNDFIICPQNALGIIDDATPDKVKQYLSVIDMIGVESLLFNTSKEDSQYRIEKLKTFAQRGKPIMAVEYIPKDQEKELANALTELPFSVVMYRAEEDAELDTLTPQGDMPSGGE